jgi:hypothetical protein
MGMKRGRIGGGMARRNQSTGLIDIAISRMDQRTDPIDDGLLFQATKDPNHESKGAGTTRTEKASEEDTSEVVETDP